MVWLPKYMYWTSSVGALLHWEYDTIFSFFYFTSDCLYNSRQQLWKKMTMIGTSFSQASESENGFWKAGVKCPTQSTALIFQRSVGYYLNLFQPSMLIS